MPRTLLPQMSAHLGELSTRLSVIVKISRADGVALGFAAAAEDIVYGGLTYKASDSLESSAVQQSLGSGVDNLEALGTLTDGRITEADIVRGLYAGAFVEVMLVKRGDPSAGHVTLQFGDVGELTVIDWRFKAEVRDLTSWLKGPVGEASASLCSCFRLGDLRCAVDVAAYRWTRAVASVADDHTFTVGAETHASGYFDSGLVRANTGQNAGALREVKTHVYAGGVTTIHLRQPFPLPLTAGDVVRLEAGCDRRFETCRDKFDNATRFHGQPSIPGNDAITRYGRGR